MPLTPLSTAILITVAREPLHGYGIMKALEKRRGPRLVAGAGSLYAALERLVEEGLLEVAEDVSDARRRRTFVATRQGRTVLLNEVARMAHLVDEARAQKLIPEGA